MALLEGKTPAERNKTIAAIALGVLALISLSYMLLGSSTSAPKKPVTNSNSPGGIRTTTSSTPRSPIGATAAQQEEITDIAFLRPVIFNTSPPVLPEASRNIFAFYVPPPKPEPTVAPVQVPTPIPPPPPNVVLASVSPANVYARTGDFTLEVTGDKFTPDVRIEINGAQLPTRFINAQQLSANIPGSLISFDGPRQVSVRSPDGQLFSNTAQLNVQAAPIPNYTFIGLLGKPSSNDTALLKEKGGKDLLSVQRGDLLGGRFRVSSISEREVAVVDTSLKIKHSLPLTKDGQSSATGAPAAPATGFPNPNQRYTPPPQGDDDDDAEP